MSNPLPLAQANVRPAHAQATRRPSTQREEAPAALQETLFIAIVEHAICVTRPKGRIAMFRAIFPYPYQIEVSRLRQTEFSKIRRHLEQVHLAWATEWKARQSDFQIENIRFQHDPNWNRRIFSIQAAHDGTNFFWGAVRVLVVWDIFGPLGLAAAVSERLPGRAPAPLSHPRATRRREPGW